MAVITAAVTHDAAALYRFVDSVCQLAEESSSSVYLNSSEDFFAYISELGKKTKEYLLDFPKNLPVNDKLKIIHRQKLTTLRGAWSELHQFIKPATDADTLNTPFSLLGALYQKFHRITGCEKVEFTVFHLNELNYLQVRASWFRQLAQKLKSQIPSAPSFPAHLGLIGIPYSQSSAVFLNALIPHEMGHFVHQQTGQANGLMPNINACLDAEPGGASISLNDRRWCVDKLSSWAEEIFCDLFAVWMVGPAYVFAYVEIFDLANIPSLASLPSAPKEHLGFHLRHPADSCRLAQHVKFLKKLGWWAHVASLRTHYIDVLRYVEAIPRTEYKFTSDPAHLANLSLAAFFRLLPSIETAIKAVVLGLDAGATDYARFARSVQDYLHSGVVPSTVLKPTKGKGQQPNLEHPDPISVLNVAYKIHLESMDVLLKQVGEKPSSIRARSEWTERLELWAAKAFEDYSLLSRGT
jgi:hypothetical protein